MNPEIEYVTVHVTTPRGLQDGDIVHVSRGKTHITGVMDAGQIKETDLYVRNAVEQGWELVEVRRPIPALPTTPGVYVSGAYARVPEHAALYRLDAAGRWRGDSGAEANLPHLRHLAQRLGLVRLEAVK